MTTTQQRTDLRLDLGLPDDEAGFTSTEIDRLYVRAAAAYSDTACIEAYVRVLACDQLRAKAVTLADYTEGDSQEKLSQVFDHLGKLRAVYADNLAAAAQAGLVSVKIGKLKKKPTTLRDYPDA